MLTTLAKVAAGIAAASAISLAAPAVASADTGTSDQVQGIRDNDQLQGALESLRERIDGTIRAFFNPGTTPQGIRDNDRWQEWRSGINDSIRVVFGNGR